MDLSGNMTVVGDLLTLRLNDLTLNCKVPRGPIGPPGRDGLSIKGDTGVQGVPGDAGRDGRDSQVPGPKGEQGGVGPAGPVPKIQIGQVITGDSAQAIISRDHDMLYTLNLILPRGQSGETGKPGKDGKHGTHELVNFNSFGNNPIFMEEMLSSHFFADGILNVPELKLEDMNRWFCAKTLNELTVCNCVEGDVVLKKNESGKFVVVPYNGQFKFTRF